jgi:hypothetical protein
MVLPLHGALSPYYWQTLWGFTSNGSNLRTVQNEAFPIEEREDVKICKQVPRVGFFLDYGVDLVRQVLMPKTVHAGQYPTVPVSKATIPTTLNVAVPQVERSKNNAPSSK